MLILYILIFVVLLGCVFVGFFALMTVLWFMSIFLHACRYLVIFCLDERHRMIYVQAFLLIFVVFI